MITHCDLNSNSRMGRGWMRWGFGKTREKLISTDEKISVIWRLDFLALHRVKIQ